MEEDYLKEIWLANCRQNYPAYYVKPTEKKKNTWDETQEECVFPGTYMSENSYASVAWRVDTIN